MERKYQCKLGTMALGIMALGIMALGILALGIMALGKLSCNRDFYRRNYDNHLSNTEWNNRKRKIFAVKIRKLFCIVIVNFNKQILTARLEN